MSRVNSDATLGLVDQPSSNTQPGELFVLSYHQRGQDETRVYGGKEIALLGKALGMVEAGLYGPELCFLGATYVMLGVKNITSRLFCPPT